MNVGIKYARIGSERRRAGAKAGRRGGVECSSQASVLIIKLFVGASVADQVAEQC